MKNNSLSVVIMAMTAGLAGVLFGYDAGIISGAILFVKNIFHMSTEMQGLVVSAVPFGALVFALLTGKFNDLFGRKKALLFTALLFIVGAIVCAAANNDITLVIGRLLLGCAIGVGSFSAPLYIAEIAPENRRGALVTINQLSIVTGILLAYIVSYLLSPMHAWRWMLGLSMIPAIILFLAALRLPRSPRWLVKQNRNSEALAILNEIHGKEKAQLEMQEIQSVLSREELSFKDTFKGGYLRIIILGVLVSILTQAVGINAIIYYAPTIFTQTGLSHTAGATLATVGIGLINFIFTLVAVFFLDKFGRRKLLLIGVLGIVLSLIVLTVGFAHGVHTPMLAAIIMASMLVFVACQAIGTGPACWLIPSEIFPLKIRGTGMGLSVAFNWGTNVVVAFLFPIVLNHWGGSTSFGIFLIISIIAFVYFYIAVPETKNISLENIEANLLAGKPTRALGEDH